MALSLIDFLIGSSWPVYLLFFLAVQRLDPEVKNFSYKQYTLIAPLYLGLINLLGGWFLGQSKQRYWLQGLVSGLIVAVFATSIQSYNYSQQKWLRYYFYIIFKHLFIHGVIIQSLTQLI